MTYGKARLFIPPPPPVRGAEVVADPVPTVEPSPRVVEPAPRRRPALDSAAVAVVLNGPGVSIGTVKVRASTPARKLRLRIYLTDAEAAHEAARILGTAAHLLDAAVVERVLFALTQIEESRTLAGDH